MVRAILWSCTLTVVSGQAFAKEYTITQKGKQFSSEELTLAPGDTVVFKNDDDTAHNVFSASEGMKFNLGVQKSGADTRHEFSSPGEGEIRCAIHPKMKLKIRVKN